MGHPVLFQLNRRTKYKVVPTSLESQGILTVCPNVEVLPLPRLTLMISVSAKMLHQEVMENIEAREKSRKTKVVHSVGCSKIYIILIYIYSILIRSILCVMH